MDYAKCAVETRVEIFFNTSNFCISFMKDEGRPFEVGFQEQASNHLKQLL